MKKTIKFFSSLFILGIFIFVSCSDEKENNQKNDQKIIGIWTLTDTKCMVETSDNETAKFIADDLETMQMQKIDTIQFLANGYYSEHNYFLNSENTKVFTGHTYSASDGKLSIMPHPISSAVEVKAGYAFENEEILKISFPVDAYYYSESYIESLGIDPAKVKIERITCINSFKRYP